MTSLINRAYFEIARRLQRDEGQTLVEYALIGVFVAIASLVALTALGKGVGQQLTNITSKL